MAKYIDTEKLKAELERRIKERDLRIRLGTYISTSFIYEDLLDFIDYLQQEESTEVDLEMEIENYFDDRQLWDTESQPSMEETARHFYQLGLNARKEN